MGYKFKPKLTYHHLGGGKVQVFFRWRPRVKDSEDSLILGLDAFTEFKAFAENVGAERMRHLANAVNWHDRRDNDDLSTLVFCINLFCYFPWDSVVKLEQAALEVMQEA